MTSPKRTWWSSIRPRFVIKYDIATMKAPIVVAKGANQIALRIRKIAAEHDIPIVERIPLARALLQVCRSRPTRTGGGVCCGGRSAQVRLSSPGPSFTQKSPTISLSRLDQSSAFSIVRGFEPRDETPMKHGERKMTKNEYLPSLIGICLK